MDQSASPTAWKPAAPVASLTATCLDGLWYFVSLRLRMVRAIAAMIATSSTTAASSKGYT